MRKLNSKVVVITFDGEDISIVASLGRSEIEELSPNTGMSLSSKRDYIVSTADLKKADGTPFLPIRGMVITDGTLTCHCTSDGMDSVFRYTTATRDRMRIHTKVVATS